MGGPALLWGGSVGGGGSDPTEPLRLTPSPGGPPRHRLWCNLLYPQPVALPRCVCGWGREGVTCPPSSPAQGSSSKAWHRLGFLQNIHHHHNNNINNNIVAVAGLGCGPGVRGGQAAPTRGRGVCWPLPGHGAACPLAAGAGRRAHVHQVSDAIHAKLLQSCPTLCSPIGGSPRGSPIPGILQARTWEYTST